MIHRDKNWPILSHLLLSNLHYQHRNMICSYHQLVYNPHLNQVLVDSVQHSIYNTVTEYTEHHYLRSRCNEQKVRKRKWKTLLQYTKSASFFCLFTLIATVWSASSDPTIWPLPQIYSNGTMTLSVCSSNFKFSTNIQSTILNNAITRFNNYLSSSTNYRP